MSSHVLRGAAFGVGLAAALAFAAPALASTAASVDGTTLRVAGDGAPDKVALFADTTNLVIDLVYPLLDPRIMVTSGRKAALA